MNILRLDWAQNLFQGRLDNIAGKILHYGG